MRAMVLSAAAARHPHPQRAVALMLPAKTGEPTCLGTGTDSPVTGDSSTSNSPRRPRRRLGCGRRAGRARPGRRRGARRNLPGDLAVDHERRSAARARPAPRCRTGPSRPRRLPEARRRRTGSTTIDASAVSPMIECARGGDRHQHLDAEWRASAGQGAVPAAEHDQACEAAGTSA